MNFHHPNNCRRRLQAGSCNLQPATCNLQRPRILHSAFCTLHSERAVALVITLILLSVITFMAVVFLVVSRTEKGSVTTATDQTIAGLEADTAIEAAKIAVMSRIMAFSNEFDFDLIVSRNYINPLGFDPNAPALTNPTNVNYDYTVTGAALTPGQRLQNLGNLLYDPRPPVFVGNEFRFYLDLNQNGRFDTNGLLPVISSDPAKPYYDLNGNTTSDPANILRNVFVGDPEWVGSLERPTFTPSLWNLPNQIFPIGYPHSATNHFIGRYAYFVQPIGKTLDLNSIHNYAKALNVKMLAGDGFLRNQGVGPWEINFAAFLVDLNTNMWPFSLPNAYNFLPYAYVTNANFPSTGAAFEDAVSLLRYRYGANSKTLASVSGLFGGPAGPGATAFKNDFIDGYSSGPLMLGNYWQPPLGTDADASKTASSWSGADNTNHLFTTQDLFDQTKTRNSAGSAGVSFTDRLIIAGTNNDSYNRYTFYRMLAQLGTDSSPEPPGRMNLNYDNLVQKNLATGIVSATNFIPWHAIDFFTNAVNRLLQAQGVNFSPGAIPVFTNNTFAYSPSVHRLLQLAANIYDATINSNYVGAATYPYLPSVFRPVFSKFTNNVYITSFVEVTSTNSLLLPGSKVVELATQGVGSLNANDLVFGVPVVIGAKKGLPNFNEFAMQNVFTITRKMQVHRTTTDKTATFTTNLQYSVNVSASFGVGAWNSYTSNYTRPVDIFVYLNTPYDPALPSMVLTNDAGLKWQGTLQPSASIQTNPFPNPLVWQGFQPGKSKGSDPAFVIALLTNVAFIPDSIYTYSPVGLNTNTSLPFQLGYGFPLPRWGLGITNRLRFLMVDRPSQRVIDYVQLSGMNIARDLTSEIASNGFGFLGLWSTNRTGSTVNDVFQGAIYQAQISSGQIPLTQAQAAGPNASWQDFGTFNAGATVASQIAAFANFVGGVQDGTTNLDIQAGFSPTTKRFQYQSWQANDPLVHYTVSDLTDVAGKGDGVPRPLPLQTSYPALVMATNVAALNRYHPWGGKDPANGSAADYNLAIQDPAVGRSDHWNFPTNKFPNAGWLGRVHRGTPWQTVYLKAADIAATDLKTWMKWCGNTNVNEAVALTPVNDRRLLEVFTAAFSDNASRGELSINQTNLASWSAIFSGVVALGGDTNDIVTSFNPGTNFPYMVIDPVGTNGPTSPLFQLVTAINDTRRTNVNSLGGAFQHLGDILAAPELTERSPFLGLANLTDDQKKWGISDAVYERLPQQVLGLLKIDHTPRFVVYAYGQALKPAPHSVLTSGQFFGMVTNYQITAETVTRAVIRIDGAPNNPHAVIESYNVLGPDQ